MAALRARRATSLARRSGSGVRARRAAALTMAIAASTEVCQPAWATTGLAPARVRTRAGARPVVAHAGWQTSVEAAIAIVNAAARRARTPEPLRRAREVARRARNAAMSAPGA